MAVLLPLAREYQIDGLTKHCEQFLLSKEPSVKNLALADEFSLQTLKEKCLDYAHRLQLLWTLIIITYYAWVNKFFLLEAWWWTTFIAFKIHNLLSQACILLTTLLGWHHHDRHLFVHSITVTSDVTNLPAPQTTPLTALQLFSCRRLKVSLPTQLFYLRSHWLFNGISDGPGCRNCWGMSHVGRSTVWGC